MVGAEDFEGMCAIVTGGASGIGAATVDLLSAQGASVAILDLQPPEGDPVRTDRRHIVTDVTDRAAVEAAVAEVVKHFGGLDVLVNSAGVGAVGDVAAGSDAEWQRVLDINVIGIARVTAAALPALRASSSGSVVNISSIAANAGLPQRALYSASKGAVHALTLAMAADHVGEGIRVNCVSPGTVDTPWVGRLLDQAPDPVAQRRLLERRQPINRLVTAQEVAEAVAYLAGRRSGSVTGTSLAVDGGMFGLRLPAPLTGGAPR